MIDFLKNIAFLINPSICVLRSEGGISANKINYNKKNRNCIVLGNGPSLKRDLPELLNRKENADFMCVNAFPLTDHFFQIQPGYLFLTDTAWWREKPNEEDSKTRYEVFKTLSRVDWQMQVIISHNGNYDFIIEQIKNDKIEVIKMRSVNIYRPLNEKAFKYYDSGYFGPPLTNVLVAAIYCAIKAGYEEIKIYGADLSYMFLIDVDQKTNEVIIEDEHFYEKDGKKVLKLNAAIDSNPITMYEFLYYQAMTFKSHELLNDYANSKGIQIFNKSSYSTIDAYPRK